MPSPSPTPATSTPCAVGRGDGILVRNLCLRRGASLLLDDVSVSFRPGEFVSILGPNGAGKSSLLKVITREISATSGTVEWDGKALGQWSVPAMARRRAVLPQESSLSFPFPVHEVVMLGRSPHLRGAESPLDYRIVQHCMDLAGVTHLARRSYLTLSGGEKHRVHFARVLAQITGAQDVASAAASTGTDATAGEESFAPAPPIGPEIPATPFLMLDEPTAALDLYHQHSVLHTARSLLPRGIGVITIVHDLTLAGRYADRIILLEKGRLVADGTPDEVLGSDTIQRVFGVLIHRHISPDDGKPVYVASTPRIVPGL
ncbi:heme ABC transporter ATP-binding protein [Verrucomicrobia bacterium LW23]|nr:heme ABC transporter ATP-binding protein [Verrucomicrobia bacterium LW23]